MEKINIDEDRGRMIGSRRSAENWECTGSRSLKTRLYCRRRGLDGRSDVVSV